MKTRIFLSIVSICCLLLGCAQAYNSNSGENGTRDSATHTTIGTNVVQDCNAEIGDNEDWYYLVPDTTGSLKIQVQASIDENSNAQLHLFDGFGRELRNIQVRPNESFYAFEPIEIQNVTADLRFFLKFTCTEGKMTYTLRSILEPPAPLEIESATNPNNAPSNSKSDDAAAEKKSRKNRNKDKEVAQPTPPPEPEVPEVTYKGEIVSISETAVEDTIIKIQGIGINTNTKPGDKATLDGLKRTVILTSCKKSYCMATVKATPDELRTYSTVTVVSR